MVRVKIFFSIDRVRAFNHQDEERLLVQYKEIEPMPAVPRVGDFMDTKILPIPEACPYFRRLDWLVKYLDWDKDEQGYFVTAHLTPE